MLAGYQHSRFAFPRAAKLRAICSSKWKRMTCHVKSNPFARHGGIGNYLSGNASGVGGIAAKTRWPTNCQFQAGFTRQTRFVQTRRRNSGVMRMRVQM